MRTLQLQIWLCAYDHPQPHVAAHKGATQSATNRGVSYAKVRMLENLNEINHASIHKTSCDKAQACFWFFSSPDRSCENQAKLYFFVTFQAFSMFHPSMVHCRKVKFPYP